MSLLTIVSQKINTPHSIGDFYEGRQIVIRYDTEVDNNTIRPCNNGSQRCIDAIIKSNEQQISRVSVRCVFPEEYNQYLKGLNRELFPLDYPFTLTLEGDLENIDDIRKGDFSSGWKTTPSLIDFNSYSFIIRNCRVININRNRAR